MGWVTAIRPRVELLFDGDYERAGFGTPLLEWPSWTMSEYASVRWLGEVSGRRNFRWRSPEFAAACLYRKLRPCAVRGCGSEATDGVNVFYSELVDDPRELVTAQAHGVFGHGLLWDYPEQSTEADVWWQMGECIAPALETVDMPIDDLVGKQPEIEPWFLDAWQRACRRVRAARRYFLVG